MEFTGVLERTVALDAEASERPQADFKLKVVAAYEEPAMRTWAERVIARLGYLVGEECIQSSWWSVADFSRLEAFAAAVHAASVADVIIVAVQPTEELPPELCAWIDVWLPRRRVPAGALVALLGVGAPVPSGALAARDYLRAVARKGELDYLPHEQILSVEPHAKAIETQPGKGTC